MVPVEFLRDTHPARRTIERSRPLPRACSSARIEHRPSEPRGASPAGRAIRLRSRSAPVAPSCASSPTSPRGRCRAGAPFSTRCGGALGRGATRRSSLRRSRPGSVACGREDWAREPVLRGCGAAADTCEELFRRLVLYPRRATGRSGDGSHQQRHRDGECRGRKDRRAAAARDPLRRTIPRSVASAEPRSLGKQVPADQGRPEW